MAERIYIGAGDYQMPEDTRTDESWSDVWRSAGAGVGAGLRAIGAELGGGEEWRRKAQQDAAEQELYRSRAGRDIPQSFSDVGSVGDVARMGAAGLIGAAPEVVPVIAGGAIGGLPGAIAGGALASGLESGRMSATRMSRGEAPQWGTTIPLAAADVALNTVGAEALVGKGIGAAATDAIGQYIAKSELKAPVRAGIGALGEAAEQSVLGGAGTLTSGYGEGRDVSAADVGEGALSSAIFGAPFGAARGLAAKARVRNEPIKPMTEGSTDVMAVASADTPSQRPVKPWNVPPEEFPDIPFAPAKPGESTEAPPLRRRRAPGGMDQEELPADLPKQWNFPRSPETEAAYLQGQRDYAQSLLKQNPQRQPVPEVFRQNPARGAPEGELPRGLPPSPANIAGPEPAPPPLRPNPARQVAPDVLRPNPERVRGATSDVPAFLKGTSPDVAAGGPPDLTGLEPGRRRAQLERTVAATKAMRERGEAVRTAGAAIQAGRDRAAAERQAAAALAAGNERANAPRAAREALRRPDLPAGLTEGEGGPAQPAPVRSGRWQRAAQEAVQATDGNQKRLHLIADALAKPTPDAAAAALRDKYAATRAPGAKAVIDAAHKAIIGQTVEEGLQAKARGVGITRRGHIAAHQALRDRIEARRRAPAPGLLSPEYPGTEVTIKKGKGRLDRKGEEPPPKGPPKITDRAEEAKAKSKRTTQETENATQARKEPQGDRTEHRGDGGQRLPERPSDSGKPEQRPQERRGGESAAVPEGKAPGKGQDEVKETAPAATPTAKPATKPKTTAKAEEAKAKSKERSPGEAAQARSRSRNMLEERRMEQRASTGSTPAASPWGNETPGLLGKKRSTPASRLREGARELKEDGDIALEGKGFVSQDDAVNAAHSALEMGQLDPTKPAELSKVLGIDKADAKKLAQTMREELGMDLREGSASAKEGGEHDLDTFRRVGEGHTAKQVLGWVAKSHPDPEVRQLALDVLNRKDLEGVGLRHGTDAERRAAPEGALGEHRNGEVLLHSARDAGQTVLHEVVHALTVKALKAGGKPAIEMRRLYSDAARQLKDHYGLKNLHEFVAEAFSNPEFRRALRELPAPKGNLWERFKSAVGKLLGLTDKQKNMLDHIERTGKSLMDDAEARVWEHGDGTPENLYRQVGSNTSTGTGHALHDGASRLWEDVFNASGDVMKKGRAWVNVATAQTNKIVQRYGHRLPALKRLQSVIDRESTRRGELHETAIAVKNSLAKVAQEGGQPAIDQMHEVFRDSQIAGKYPHAVEPDKAQADLAQAMKKLDAAGKDTTSVPYLEAKAEVARAQAAVNMRASWEKMTDTQKQAVNHTFKALKDNNDLAMRSLKDTFGSDATHLFQGIKDPYVPVRRYGSWIVNAKSKALLDAEAELKAYNQSTPLRSDATPEQLAKQKELRRRVELLRQDADHHVVQSVNNEREATEIANGLKEQMGEGASTEQFERENFAQSNMRTRDSFFTEAMNKLDENWGNSPIHAQMRKLLEDAYMEQFPDGHAATRKAQREMIAGHDMDFSRAAVERLTRDAYRVAKMENSRALSESLSDLRAQTKEQGDTEAQAVYKTMEQRVHAYGARTAADQLSQKLSDAAHTYFLGANPGYLLTQLLQTPMIAGPAIAKHHGIGASYRELMQGIKDMKGVYHHDRGLDLEKFGKDSMEYKVLQRLERMGLIDMTPAHETARIARGEKGLLKKGDPISRAAWLRDMAGVPAQHIEAFGRGGTALAALRLAEKEGINGKKLNEEQLFAHVVQTLRDSHIDYSATENPNAFRGPGLRLALQFQKYSLAMSHIVKDTFTDAFGMRKELAWIDREMEKVKDDPARLAELKESREELEYRSKAARRHLIGLAAMTQLFAGSLGLPGIGVGFTAADVIRDWTGDPEDQADTRADVQQWLADTFGTDAGTLIARGLPAALGLDLSKRVGMASTLSPETLDQFYRRARSGGPEKLGSVAADTLTKELGPVWGMGQQVLTGLGKMIAGNYTEGAATMLPRAVGQIFKGVSEFDQPIKIGGKEVHPAVNGSSAFWNFLGVPSTEVSVAKDLGYAAASDARRLTTVRTQMLDELIERRKNGDSSIPEHIQKFNERNPGAKVTMGDAVKAIRKETAPAKTPKAGTISAVQAGRRAERMKLAAALAEE